MSKSIVGIANSTSQVEATLADLQNDGLVASSDISLLMPDSGPNAGDTPELGAVKATKAPKGATTGAVSGGAIGGTGREDEANIRRRMTLLFFSDKL